MERRPQFQSVWEHLEGPALYDQLISEGILLPDGTRDYRPKELSYEEGMSLLQKLDSSLRSAEKGSDAHNRAVEAILHVSIDECQDERVRNYARSIYVNRIKKSKK